MRSLARQCGGLPLHYSVEVVCLTRRVRLVRQYLN